MNSSGVRRRGSAAPGNKKTRTPREAAVNAAARAFLPIARMMLEVGVGSKEAEAVLRRAFVDAAHSMLCRELGPNVPVTTVAMRCGLDRKAVAKHMHSQALGYAHDVRPLRLNRILDAWHTHPEFISSVGRPKVLPLYGRVSFDTLVRRFAGDVYPPSVLEELTRVGAVERAGRSSVRAAMRTFVVGDVRADALDEAGALSEDVLESLRLNAFRNSPPRLASVAVSLNVDSRQVPRIRNLLRDRCDAFEKTVRDILEDGALPVEASTARVRLGILTIEVGDMNSLQADRASVPIAGGKARATPKRKRSARA